MITEIDWVEPAALALALGDAPGLAWLDGSAADERSKMSYLCLPPCRRIEARDGRVLIDGDPVGDDPLSALARVLGDRRPAVQAPFRFTGGLVAMLGYGIGQALVRQASRHADPHGLPDMVAGLHDEVIAFDAVAGRAWIASPDPGATARLVDRLRVKACRAAGLSRAAFVSELSGDAYRAGVSEMRARIAAGEMFQANMTQRHVAPRPARLRAVDVQVALRGISPAPFGAMIVWDGRFALCGVSPERFVSVDAGGRVETPPLNGTAPRAAAPAEDRRLAADLAGSAKDRAEHLMIVDLTRNDLGRVCATGSIAVPQLQVVESFASVHHMVSAVEGVLAPGYGPIDLLRAALPGGSVTGAPKIQAMAVIDALEASRRGPYCGAVAWIGHDGAMDSSIIIRSLALTPTRMIAASGGAITSDSNPDAEHAEMLLKVAPIRRAFAG